ncbi:CRTAC1 family protein [Spirosoma panaciterrae]|uniref:CRTAC1 family protein n=1 Tax=Spirosoma panaciterrae TaxID=496058 RepID=UPI00036C8B6D|nr:CRTAC1 family protein [Spirosoma panaciterrae]
MNRTLTITLLFCGLSSWAEAQLSFRNTSSTLPGSSFRGLWTKAVVDVNGDGRDDIVRTRFPSSDLFVVYQQANGSFRSDSLRQLPAIPLSTVVGDVNRDGRNDILTGGNNDGITIHYNQGSNFTMGRIESPLILMQAATLSDMNRDGWLDYVALNDVGLNQIWKNDQTGHLQTVSNWIDMRTVPTSDNSGSYGLVWSDIDNDGDLDLYIARCSHFAMGPENAGDPRRINQLFINHSYDRINGQIVKNTKDFNADPTGWFTEEAAAYNVKISGQSWTADFADIDNDGDQDLLVTNHESPTMLLENDGVGHFTDITTLSGLDGLGKPLQGIMRDFDNDGYVDILIAGSTEGQLWLNNHNKTFRRLVTPFDATQMQSFAVGDLNHDGFLDVYSSYDPNGSLTDKLWLNNGNSNHFSAITLLGSVSNKNGIGARITLYRDDGSIQVREVRGGESYGITNSYTQIFGLGQSTSNLSHIRVEWPSGNVMEYRAPPPDSYVYLREEGCMVSSPAAPCVATCQCVPITVTVIQP